MNTTTSTGVQPKMRVDAKTAQERRVSNAFERFKENLSTEIAAARSKNQRTYLARYVDAGVLAGENSIAATNSFLETAFGIDSKLGNKEKEALIRKARPEKVFAFIPKHVIFGRIFEYCLEQKYDIELRGGFNHYGWFNGISLHIVLSKD